MSYAFDEEMADAVVKQICISLVDVLQIAIKPEATHQGERGVA